MSPEDFCVCGARRKAHLAPFSGCGNFEPFEGPTGARDGRTNAPPTGLDPCESPSAVRVTSEAERNGALRETIKVQADEIERLKKESAAHWNLARVNGEEAVQLAETLIVLRDAAETLCGSEGIAVDDDTTEVSAGWLSELRRVIDASRTTAAKDRINDLRRAARSVVEAWNVERADKFSADWHAEFRSLAAALRAFQGPIPKASE